MSWSEIRQLGHLGGAGPQFPAVAPHTAGEARNQDSDRFRLHGSLEATAATAAAPTLIPAAGATGRSPVRAGGTCLYSARRRAGGGRGRKADRRVQTRARPRPPPHSHP